MAEPSSTGPRTPDPAGTRAEVRREVRSAAPAHVSQWLTLAATHAVIERGEDPAGLVDWAAAGYPDAATFRLWARNSCGVACLRSWLTHLGLDLPDTWTLTRELVDAGAYRVDGDRIRGLLHAPTAAWLRERWGVDAELVTPIGLDQIVAYVRRPGAAAIVSVHPGVRWPEREPAGRGGHLVLAFDVSDGPVPALVLNNPSGLGVAHGAVEESAAAAIVPLAAIEPRRSPHALLLGPE